VSARGDDGERRVEPDRYPVGAQERALRHA
jgi:hypothetical protein